VRKKSWKTVLLIITLLVILVLALFPILYPLMSSFRTDKEIYEYSMPFQLHTLWPVSWTLDNYKLLFTEYHFGRYLLNTLFEIGVIIPLTILICSLAAFAFTFYNFRGKKALFALFMVTFMIPAESIALPMYQLVNSMHMVNTYWALILPALANGLTLFMFIQSFRDIPPSLLEAARIDGGGWWTCYWQVVMPLSKAIIVAMCLMTFVNEWNNYLWPLLVARLDNVKTVTIAICAFKEENVTHWSMIYASSMFSALLPICIFLPFQKYFVQGITSSGVKG
jgi:multiple sugar transport system permease protein